MRLVPILCFIGLIGCSDPAPTVYDLGASLSVEVDHRGGWTVQRDGEPLLSSVPGGAIEARTYEEQILSVVGFWTFRRIDEMEQRWRGTSAHTQREDGTVEIAYPGDGQLTIRRDENSVDFEFQRPNLDTYSSISANFSCDEASSFHGFGAQYNRTNQRGHAFHLWVQEQGIGRTGTDDPILGGEYHTYFPMPYWLDLRGYAVLFDTSARVQVDLCATDPETAQVEVEHGAPLRWTMFISDSPAGAIDALGAHLGRPQALPAWAYDLWIGAQGGRDNVLATADALEAAEIPVGALWVQDWTGRQDFGLGNFGVRYRWVDDPEFYPDLAGMIAELRSRDIRFLGYANPFIVEAFEDHFPTMRDEGLLVLNAEGEPYLMGTPNGQAGLPDLTNPAARTYVKEYLTRMVTDFGMDGWMVDFGEWLPHDAVLFDGSNAWLQHNLYPTEWHRLSLEVMQEQRPDGDFALFSRSGWTGEHSVAQIVWIGDQECNFEIEDGLPTVVPAMLNMGLSGIPFVTHDVGGFSGGPRTPELMMRWTELGAFTPVMRTHEGLRREENHMWDSAAETQTHFRRFARVHAALRPLFEELEAEAIRTSMPPIRHLALHHVDDPETHNISDAYLLGADLLVAPIVDEGATRREVYLPAGEWFHVWTGESYTGPTRITIEAPIGSPPVFSRGSDRADLRAIE